MKLTIFSCLWKDYDLILEVNFLNANLAVLSAIFVFKTIFCSCRGENLDFKIKLFECKICYS